MSTDTIDTAAQTASGAADHPVNPLSAEEIRAVRRIVDDNGLLGAGVRFVYVALDEPHKKTVQAFKAGDPIDRRARVLLLDRATGQGNDLVVSVTNERIDSSAAVDGSADGHVPILDQEFEDIESFVLDCPEWLDAMRKRELDPASVRAVPLSADWPVMPVDYAGFKLKPVGFFNRNPALNTPVASKPHCCES
jgi:primary-amine oxidase